MVSNRGLPSDYADWVARGAAGWDWEDVLPFFIKLETDLDRDGPLHGNGRADPHQPYTRREMARLHPGASRRRPRRTGS